MTTTQYHLSYNHSFFQGYVQGLNMSVMNLGTAVSPYILGEVADNFSVSTAMWACIVISFLAAAVNMPLLFVSVLKPRRPKPPKWARGLQWEDPEFVDRALSGDWVPSKQLDLLNLERMRKGQPFLVIPIRSYEEDKQKGLSELKAQSKADLLRFVTTWRKSLKIS